MVRYGIYDTKDNLWMGDDHGPKLFSEGDVMPGTGPRGGQPMTADEARFFARASAQMTGVQLGWHPLRLEARAYHLTAPRVRDAVDTKMTPLEALRRVEDGAL